ncbi:hypothetical protein FB451DRAFT_1419888 [Mycena latifolia]|nr:hypothetical protein FB451DRAFT_1419888 [Mycena latifolia]
MVTVLPRSTLMRNTSQTQISSRTLTLSSLGFPIFPRSSISQDLVRSADFLDPRDLEVEFDAVRRWGDISPTLRIVVLPSETSWVRLPRNVWYPATKAPNTLHMLVRVKWLLARVVSSRELYGEYTRIAEVVAGKDTVDRLRSALERLGRIPEFEIAMDATGMAMSFPAD